VAKRIEAGLPAGRVRAHFAARISGMKAGKDGRMLEVGMAAPEARVAVRPKEWAGLRELIGGRPALLLFFPFAFSSTCTEEMCAIADDWSGWSGLDGAVIGLSVDSPYVNVKFAESTNATFPIVSDFNREAIRAYDVVRPELNGLLEVAERTAFVIGRDGRIVYAWIGEHPGVMPPLAEIRDALTRA
jgi:peroxiredoxin